MSILTVVAESAATPSLDLSIVDQLMGLITKFMSLFTVFPLNFMIMGSIAGIVFSVIRMGKRAAK